LIHRQGQICASPHMRAQAGKTGKKKKWKCIVIVSLDTQVLDYN